MFFRRPKSSDFLKDFHQPPLVGEPAEHFLIEPKIIKPKKNYQFWLKLTAVIILIFFLIIIAPAAVAGYNIYFHATAISDRVAAMALNVGQADFNALAVDLKQTQSDLAVIKKNFLSAGPILFLPPARVSTKSLTALIDAATDLLSGYEEILAILAEFKSETELNKVALGLATPAEKRRLLQAILNHRETLQAAQEKISRAQAVLNEINLADFNGWGGQKIRAMNELLGQVVGNSQTALPVFKYLPELLGYQQAKNYLLIFQNDMELRPTGGFIGSYGLLTVLDGEIKNIFIDDVYNLDKLSQGKLTVAAPWPMTAYNSQKYFFLRDANWSPDWPTSAETILDFYRQESQNAGRPAGKIDGVIGFTPQLIADFLKISGPLKIRGIVFNGDNFKYELEKFVEFDYSQHGLASQERKLILSELTGQLAERLTKFSSLQLLQLWGAFKNNIDQKNILVYLTDNELQAYFASQNWSGTVKNYTGDYLMVIDSNLAALKTDQAITREINYDLTVNPQGELIANLALTYHHNSKPVKDLISRYRDYVRIYLPVQSWIIKASIKSGGMTKELAIDKDLTLSDELNKRVAATFFTVEPLTSATLTLQYRLPENLQQDYQNGLYKLFVQQQPGAAGHGLKINLNFNRPISAYFADKLPSFLKAAGVINWQGNLTGDQEYRVKF